MINRREFVCDIIAPSTGASGSPPAFVNQGLEINPGLERTFPWLSQIAANYEEYMIHQLVFTYRSTVTDVGSSTTGQCGTVIMATNYNSSSPIFEDKEEMMQYSGAMSCKATEHMVHGVECDPAKLTSAGGYIRTVPALASQDKKTYDHGTFQIGIANSPTEYANRQIGELWVSYTVELRKPKFYTSRGLSISSDVFVSRGTIANATPFGTLTDMLRGQQNTLNCAITTEAGYIHITFDDRMTGSYEIRLVVEDTSATGSAAHYIGTVTGNVRSVADLYAGGSPVATTVHSQQVTQSAHTNGRSFLVMHVDIGGRSGTTKNGVDIALNTSLTFSATAQAELRISEYNVVGSYRSAGLAPSDSPVLVNSSGQVTTL